MMGLKATEQDVMRRVKEVEDLVKDARNENRFLSSVILIAGGVPLVPLLSDVNNIKANVDIVTGTAVPSAEISGRFFIF